MQWNDLVEGRSHEGILRNTVGAGRFVELAPGLEGLILHSTVEAGGWSNASALGHIDDRLEVRVLSIDSRKGRLRLCPAKPGPAGISTTDELFESLKKRINQTVPTRLKQATSVGRFADLGYGLDGLLPATELSRVGYKAEDLGDFGDRVELIVHQAVLERNRMRVRLRYQPNTEVTRDEGSNATRSADRLVFVVDGSNAVRSADEPGYDVLVRFLSQLDERHPGSSARVVVDASLLPALRHDFDDPDSADRLRVDIEAGRVTEAPGGKDADQMILSLARAQNAVVVSRDWFKDYPKERAGVRLLAWEQGSLELLAEVTVHDEAGRSIRIPILPGST